MEWLEKLLNLGLGGLPKAAAALCPEHVKKQWLERLSDQNPFKAISANHDLVRATRLAWIEAAQDVVKEARQQRHRSEWRRSADEIERFASLITDALLDTRDHALDRRSDPGSSPIDAHVNAVINGVPELVSPGSHPDVGQSVTTGFSDVLAGLSGWPVAEIPAIFGQIARNGLPTHGGGRTRNFGELVFAAFANIIKDPKKYPQACEAFYIAMDKLARDVGEATLAAVQGLDARFEAAIARLDGLDVLRNGAVRYLDLLPGIVRNLEATRSDVAEILRIVSQRESVPLETLREILLEMEEPAQTSDAGEIQQKLAAKASEFKALTERLNRLSNADPEVARLRREAATALAKGHFTEADGHLAAAEARDLAGLEDLEALAKQKRLSAAETRAERAAAAMLRANPDAYREAASHYAEAAYIASAADPKIARGYTRQQGQVLYTLGMEFGSNSALLEAIEHFRSNLSSFNRGDNSLEWAKMQNDLGNSISSLGEREGDTARLEEAIDTYREALKELAPEREPLQWAETQNNLGATLQTLGERKGDMARLEEATDAYREALKERTHGRVPLEWAVTQNNLGNALQALGNWETGTARLEEAVTAYREALKELTPERVPLQWATTQNNLGAALLKLGEREGDMARLEEAIDAYREALKERTHGRVPLEWAVAQNNLGNALQALGNWETGTARLEEAVTAYREALKELTPKRVPLQWAATQYNLGNALLSLGEWESGTARLQEAVDAYHEVLKEWTYKRVPLDWAMCSGSQGVAMSRIAEHGKDFALAQTALEQIQVALDTFEKAEHASYAAHYSREAATAREILSRLTLM